MKAQQKPWVRIAWVNRDTGASGHGDWFQRDKMHGTLLEWIAVLRGLYPTHDYSIEEESEEGV